ncbi:MAG: type III-B CRISPR module RAMP protein Cmr6 [Bryobacteraceae bacterium]
MRSQLTNLPRDQGHHPGLILQKYLTKHDDSKARAELLTAVIQASQNAALRSLYREAFERWLRSFDPTPPHMAEQLATVGRLIVGLGSESVLETGLKLHHIYGVPIIPGSALKGLASHYCHDIWGQRYAQNAPEENCSFRRSGPYHNLLFGRTDSSGVITFHDAWITPDSLNAGALRLDVMTPHHPKWQSNEAPPTDFDSPIPVSFLSVVGAFDIRVSWSGPKKVTTAQAWVALAMSILREALAEWGVGGKTTSGYGRLADPANEPQARTPQSPPLKVHEDVEVKLLERNHRGTWIAKHEASGLSGPIANSPAVPADKNAGETLTVKVSSVSVNKKQIQFRYHSDR